MTLSPKNVGPGSYNITVQKQSPSNKIHYFGSKKRFEDSPNSATIGPGAYSLDR